MRMRATMGGAWPTSGMASAPAANPPIASRKTANSAAATRSANTGMTTYSELTRSRSAKSDPAARDATGSTMARGAPVATGGFDTGSFPSSLGRRADDALQQVIHLVEERIEVVVGLVDHDLAFIVLERPDVDRLLGLEALDGHERGFLRLGRSAGAEWRVLYEID